MRRFRYLKSTALAGASVFALANGAWAESFDIPAGGLEEALNSYSVQTGQQLLYPNDLVRGVRTKGAAGEMTANLALSRILNGTGLSTRHEASALIIVRDAPQAAQARIDEATPVRVAAAAASGIESVVVTSSKIKGDIQTVPIAITALSQEQLTSRQIAGGPDLVKEVPNLTFSKTNFSGYNIQIRGIGTQAISVTTDPAVAVAFNDTPFIRNHFFEQEFYDLSQAEVLRGPQGTLYGRNATAGVVNLISAKPTDQFEAMASADIGNYHNRRYEGMVNVPIVDDRLDLRVAGEWTKRDGYSFNETTNAPIDGRDLWSSRVTLGWKPVETVQAYLVWEHFSENDDRLRSGKQLCKTDFGPGSVLGDPKPVGVGYAIPGDYFTQGCIPTSLYGPDAFQAPLGYALPYILGLQDEGNGNAINPYSSETQSHDLRVIDSGINPIYRAKNDTVEFNADYAMTPALTLTSQTGFNNDFLFSAEDFNRFGAAPGLFEYQGDGVNPQFNGVMPDPNGVHICAPLGGGDCTLFSGSGVIPNGGICDPHITNNCTIAGYMCDPQVGCSNRLILEDLSTERAWQFSQEFRLASNFSGPLNFSAGGNYLHYETTEKYYVFGNVLTLINGGFVPGEFNSNTDIVLVHGFQFNNLGQAPQISGGYVDPNPISSLNDNGHNYFLSKNPYVLNSYAAFGEANYSISDELKLTGGLRWTDDQKHFLDIPSWLVEEGWGYPVAGTVDQQWNQLTGRAVANWTPKLDFTDQTLIYGSFAHGYKAGGANPPGAIYSSNICIGAGQCNIAVDPTHPLTFKPEFVDAYELGSKNTLLDGALTLNGDVFFYNYKGYQISEIVDRTAINTNFNATVHGAELESTWEPAPGLKFTFAGGYEGTRIDNGESAVDLMDRTAGHRGWFVVKPFVNESSNCIFPAYVAKWIRGGASAIGGSVLSYCGYAYLLHDDPFTSLPYVANPTVNSEGQAPHALCGGNLPPCEITDYPGYDPLAGTPGDPYTGQNTADGIDYGPVPNNGAGFSKNLSGKQLPNAPHFTTSFSAEYTMPVSEDWAATLHSDFYWQSQSYARVFNDRPYDKIRGYSTTNFALILTSANGWQVMGYLKNAFNVTAITGDFLNSDDTGLTTNVFLTDPRLYGVRVTKNW
jgi:iron complex outermembrane recepter protein